MDSRKELLYGYPVSDKEREDSMRPNPPKLELSRNSEIIIPLTMDFTSLEICNDLLGIMKDRASKRLYSTETPLSLTELSYLLWMTQGVKEIAGMSAPVTVRTVPSAGCRHALETYVFVNFVEGLENALYHYLPVEHQLELVSSEENQRERLKDAFCGQSFFSGAPVAFLWTAVPYRMAWRYGEMAEKLILLDAGHVCENLYLAGASIGCGVCAIGAYYQELADQFLQIGERSDMETEAVIYAASVGKKD